MTEPQRSRAQFQPEDEWIARVRAGDESAFDALVRAHYARLYNYAYRFLCAREAAEDAVQEVFLKVWERRAGPPLQDPLAYLYQAVRNQCLMALNRERRWKIPPLTY